MRIQTKSSLGTQWMRTLDTTYPMDKHTFDMIDAVGQKMAEQFKTRPKNKWEDVMLCNIFVMTESARLMGSQGKIITTTPEESWQLAVNTFEKTKLGLDDGPIPPDQSMIDFVRQWSDNLKKLLKTK